MKTLEVLYAMIRNLQNSGIPIEGTTRKKLEEIEEEIIQKEVFPLLSEAILPLLKEVQRDLVLVVEYQPDMDVPVNIKLSRKVNKNEVMNANASPQSIKINTPLPQIEESKPKRHVENKTKGISVTFPDGTIISCSTSIQTFVYTLEKIGFERVNQLYITYAGYNIVSREKRLTENKRWQYPYKDWYIYSNMSNTEKRRLLEEISNKLKLHLRIEIND